MVTARLLGWREEEGPVSAAATAAAEVNLKKYIYINIRPDTIKLLDENIGIILFDINRSNVFLDLSPRVMDIKTKTSKYKLKSLCAAKKL